jgi:hypothetical protein
MQKGEMEKLSVAPAANALRSRSAKQQPQQLQCTRHSSPKVQQRYSARRWQQHASAAQ